MYVPWEPGAKQKLLRTLRAPSRHDQPGVKRLGGGLSGGLDSFRTAPPKRDRLLGVILGFPFICCWPRG